MHVKLALTSILYLCATLIGVAQSVYSYPDSLAGVISLHEIEVTGGVKPETVEISRSDGSFSIGAQALDRSASLLGNYDPIRLMQALPSVASADFISGGLYVQGCENAHNSVCLDGVEIYNPMHLLGLFSVFNSSHFSSFDINLNPNGALCTNFAGAEVLANTAWRHPTKFTADLTAGIIDSHGSIYLPLAANRSSLTLSARDTYVNALFGDAIKVENAPLHYGFDDFNLTYLQTLNRNWKLKISSYYGRDGMNLLDPNYASDIDMGWSNVILGATLRKAGAQLHTLGFSRFANNVKIAYTNIDKQMPSNIWSLSYSGQLKVRYIDLGIGAVYRHASPQVADPATAAELFSPSSLEARIGASAPITLWQKLTLTPGFKIVYFAAKDISKLYPLPSLSVNYTPVDAITLSANISRRAQFVHKVEESAIGLPTDFFITASGIHKPLISTDLSVDLQGTTLGGILTYYLAGYYRRFSNLTAWLGNLFSMLGTAYEPLSDVVNGSGRSMGISAMMMADTGKVNAWISYTLARSTHRYPSISPSSYPYSHDRTHDLKLNLSWRIIRSLTFSASFVYATGYPYTEPLYAYMIGENLIFEFKDHNSSRLPDMHRLDLSLKWHFLKSRQFTHTVNIGVFNAYGHNNVMFKSFKYSPAEGFRPTQWSMAYILPSVSYNIKF